MRSINFLLTYLLIYVSNSDLNLPRIVVAGRGHLNNNISRYMLGTPRPLLDPLVSTGLGI